MNGKSTGLAVHAAFIAAPDQPFKRTSLVGKEKGGPFLAKLTTLRAALLAPPRAACTGAIAAAAAAVAAADADLQPLPLLPRRTTSRLPRSRWPPSGPR